MSEVSLKVALVSYQGPITPQIVEQLGGAFAGMVGGGSPPAIETQSTPRIAEETAAPRSLRPRRLKTPRKARLNGQAAANGHADSDGGGGSLPKRPAGAGRCCWRTGLPSSSSCVAL